MKDEKDWALTYVSVLAVCIGYDTYQHASEREKWYRCGCVTALTPLLTCHADSAFRLLFRFLIAVASFDFLLIALLIPFFFWHLMMIARNQTTIESSSFPHYDVGLCANLRQASLGNTTCDACSLPRVIHEPHPRASRFLERILGLGWFRVTSKDQRAMGCDGQHAREM